jgi:EAL and modified HD-GYP domain-containing signal transduction protein
VQVDKLLANKNDKPYNITKKFNVSGRLTLIMQVYTARQAILNNKQHVVAYELLFRGGEKNTFPYIKHYEEKDKTAIKAYIDNDLEFVTVGKPVLIYFTEDCFLSDMPELLPNKKVVIGLVDKVSPSDEVFNKCNALFKKGYNLSLDDFVYNKQWNRFFSLMKLIKFDISRTPLDKIGNLITTLNKLQNFKLLAGHVETRQDYEKAKAMGFHLFQGYFFCRPSTTYISNAVLGKGSLVALCKTLCEPTLNTAKIINYFKSDAELTHKLFYYINSSALSLKEPVFSIKQAIFYLGESRLKKILTMMIASHLAKNKSREIFVMAIIRASACELLSEKIAPRIKDKAFLVGLLSLVGSMLDKPLSDALDGICASGVIKNALLNTDDQSTLRSIYRSVLLTEEGQWHLATIECMKLNVNHDYLCQAFDNSVKWCNEFEEVMIACEKNKKTLIA